MDNKVGQILKYSLSLVVAALCIWLVARKIDWSSFWIGLQGTRWLHVGLFVIASILALVFRMARWRDLLRPMDPSIRNADVWDSINVGNVVNVALPGAGELLRCGLVKTGKASYDKAMGTIVMERFCDILAIAVLIVLALALKWASFAPFFQANIIAPMSGGFSLWWVAAILLALAAAAVILVWRFRDSNKFCGRIAGFIKGILQGFTTFFQMPHKFRFLMYTVGLWLMYVMMSYFGLKAVPALSELTFVDALFISAIGNIASVIPVPSGMGPYHYLVMTTLVGLYGCPSETGLLYAVLCHETHAILIVVLGFMSYLALSVRSGRSKQSE